MAVGEIFCGLADAVGDLSCDTASQVSGERLVATESPSNRQKIISTARGAGGVLGNSVGSLAGAVSAVWVNRRTASSSLRFQRRMQGLPRQADALPNVWGGHPNKGACDGSWVKDFGEIANRSTATAAGWCSIPDQIPGSPARWAPVPFSAGNAVSMVNQISGRLAGRRVCRRSISFTNRRKVGRMLVLVTQRR